MDYTVTEHMQMLLYSDKDYLALRNYYRNKYKENPQEFGKYEYKRFYVLGAIECNQYRTAHFIISSYYNNSNNTLKILYEDLGDCDYKFATDNAKHKDFWLNMAIKNFEKAISLGNTHVELYYKISKAYDKLCQYEKAIEYCKKAIETDSSYYMAYYFKADLFQNIKQYDDAIQTYKDLKNRFKNEEIYYNVGKILLQKGDIKKALKIFRQGYEADEDHDKYLIYRNEIIYCYEQLKDYKNVLKVYNNMLDDKSKDIQMKTYVYNRIAGFYKKIGEIDNAVKYYQKTLKIRTKKTLYNKAEAYKELSPIYYEKKNFKKALNYANKALEIYKECVKNWGMTFSPESDIDITFVVDCLIFIANSTLALDFYKKAIDSYILLLEYMKYLDESQYGAWLEKAIPNVNIVIGEIYIRLNKIKTAEKYLDKHPQAETLPLYHLCKAEIAYRNKDKAKIESHYEKYKNCENTISLDKNDLLTFTFLKDYRNLSDT